MKKKKEKGLWLNTLITSVEVLFLLILFLGYVLEAVVFTTKTVVYFFDRENYISYSEIFYDAGFTHESDKENFSYLYNITTNYDRDLIENHNALDIEVTTFVWMALIKRIMWLVIVILLCELIRTFTKDKDYFKKEKIEKVIKIKGYLFIACIITVITNTIIAIFTPFENTLLLSILITIIIYSLTSLIELLLKEHRKK